MFALLGVVLVAGAPCVLPAAAGGTKLKPPQNVEVDIIDDTFTLRWARSREPAGNVTVSADYRMPRIVDNWTKLPGCQHVTSATCDFSSLKMHVYEEIKLRIRAEEGNSTSPWRELDTFIPFQQARIGPPKVHLEAEDKAIAINISPPGAKDSVMWQQENPQYSVIIWRNASGAQTWNETHHSRFPRIKIHKLVPETTYCVRVKARLLLHWNPAEFSPVHCVSTTVENELPAPENIQVILENDTYVLKWDYTHDNVTFEAQWLKSYLKRMPGSQSEKWAQVQGCERAPVARCAPPQDLFRKGIYFRVRASRGSSSSPWSQEEKFDAGRQVVIPPLIVALKPLSSRSLQVSIGFQDQTELQHSLTYEVRFWENASNAERKTFVEQRADFPVLSLKPRTVYCADAQALLEDGPRSQRSRPSNTACAATEAGGAPGALLVAGVAVMLVLCAALALGKLVHYVFFPAGKPPATIEEYFPEEPTKNLLLSTSVEQTEECFIVENVDAVSAKEVNHLDEDHRTYTSQASQDSGHYSIEDESGESGESGGSQAGEELGQRGAGAHSAGGRFA
ncbi:interferon alpha/beta receptor 1 isoform X2 [Myotis myotis]|uniref:Interferon alpha and beta receptor subunit 1 n=1 Tax=Myotis myotis TaxID=51298 RepID=A0A7J7ZX12_MYOMY|nr:interferon alpha/beta receptor 1 isoform X2 [Myotis myotis]KAF6378406.1 interferon alpha and beta receptor subunit 1 [Myotis myotis]